MLGKRIAALRKSLGLTKVDFAAKLGMTSHAVYEWEYDKVEIKESSLRLIESIFQVNPEWLRKGKGSMFMAAATTDITPDAEIVFTWIKSLSSPEQTWLKIEMQNRFPEFKKWMAKQKSS